MKPQDKCPTCGADTPAGDWKRWPVNPGVNLERELALARARIARLEEAGDKMLSVWLMPKDSMSYSDWVCLSSDAKSGWYAAKEAKP